MEVEPPVYNEAVYYPDHQPLTEVSVETTSYSYEEHGDHHDSYHAGYHPSHEPSGSQHTTSQDYSQHQTYPTHHNNPSTSGYSGNPSRTGQSGYVSSSAYTSSKLSNQQTWYPQPTNQEDQHYRGGVANYNQPSPYFPNGQPSNSEYMQHDGSNSGQATFAMYDASGKVTTEAADSSNNTEDDYASSYMAWSLINCLCCCCILGIVAVGMSRQIEEANLNGKCILQPNVCIE